MILTDLPAMKDMTERNININKDKLSSLTECSRLLDEILNRKPNKSMAYVGASAFSHKGGLHVSAVQVCVCISDAPNIRPQKLFGLKWLKMHFTE